jgi:hypothetical protein
MGKRFLIGQLGAFGDCLYATTVAKQIKHDYPDAHITWAIAPQYASVLSLNPHVDAILEIPIEDGLKVHSIKTWEVFVGNAQKAKDEGLYDELVLTQTSCSWHKFDGTIRTSTYNGYSRNITVSIEPVIRLYSHEVNNVKRFAEKHQLTAYKEVVLFECSPNSSQSNISIDFAINVSNSIIKDNKDICFIISSPNTLRIANDNIIDASSLSFRENAELTKYCTLLIGCSSGLSWLSTCDWAKKLNTIQILNFNYSIYAGMIYDFAHWGLDTTHIVELSDKKKEQLTVILKKIFSNSFKDARFEYNMAYKPSYWSFVKLVHGLNIKKKFRIFEVYKLYKYTIERNKILNVNILHWLFVFFYLLSCGKFAMLRGKYFNVTHKIL